jgi:uncharacterized membrane protein YkvA (DUF1232 family)
MKTKSAKHDDRYQKMRTRISAWLNKPEHKNYKYAEYILAAPDLLHLMVKLTFDKRISKRSKAILAFGLAYFISPVDLLPEALFGPLGYIDDIGVAAFILKKIINESNQNVVLEHWAGEENILILIEKIIDNMDDMVGGDRLKKIKRQLGL